MQNRVRGQRRGGVQINLWIPDPPAVRCPEHERKVRDFQEQWARPCQRKLAMPRPSIFPRSAKRCLLPGRGWAHPSSYFRQLVVGKIGESVQTQWHEHGSSGRREAPSG